jgi:hypothetical protein
MKQGKLVVGTHEIDATNGIGAEGAQPRQSDGMLYTGCLAARQGLWRVIFSLMMQGVVGVPMDVHSRRARASFQY